MEKKILPIQKDIHGWDWNILDSQKCEEKGHVLMAPPHCEDNHLACYRCKQKWSADEFKTEFK